MVTGNAGTGRLAGEVAVVTGSTAGLGRVIAELFAAEGASVVVTGRSEGPGAAIVEQVRASGGSAAFIAADLGSPGDRARLIEATIAQFGAISILVNNAVSPDAIARDGTVTETVPELWEEMLSLVVVAAADLIRHAVPPMVAAGRGSIVNVSAKSAQIARPGLVAYSSAKAALDALSRSVTAEYGRAGIRANTVQPGYILHERRDVPMTPERRAELEAAQLTRLATARDVALAVLFLASREAEVITGITLPVDGGSTVVRGKVL